MTLRDIYDEEHGSKRAAEMRVLSEGMNELTAAAIVKRPADDMTNSLTVPAAVRPAQRRFPLRYESAKKPRTGSGRG